MTRLIFLGPPGAGKGTQAYALAQAQQIPHISTGDILRTAVALKTELGEKAQAYMDKGELVPDHLILEMVRDRLGYDDVKAGWILDGFPRTVTQATFLDDLLNDLHQSCDWVVNFDVPDEVLVERLLGRGRKDDTEEVIRNRLSVYREQTAPLIDFYRERNKLVSVDGNQSIETVSAALDQIVHSNQ
ncbi:adenylate kinase [Thermocoleostomius sinensis]|uniref:Adenylate kinase n=1 Tax=Thermocoleostomius sinensis A174 TaxID=2016057 RepID=A0A9E8ZFX0_9CYAN|nr:adenylate kinase [Thermocoleostomius sinensis]WAL61094.1 adenylate kinase [Thermocoleostomius sinensis A174]